MPGEIDDNNLTPDTYDAQAVLASREIWRGIVAAYELRLGHADTIIKDLRAQIDAWRKTATTRRQRAQNDDANSRDLQARANRAAASVYEITAVQAEAIINGTQMPGKTSYELSTELRDRIVERTARDLERIGAIDKNRPANAGPWVNAPLSVVVGLMLAEGTHRP